MGGPTWVSFIKDVHNKFDNNVNNRPWSNSIYNNVRDKKVKASAYYTGLIDK